MPVEPQPLDAFDDLGLVVEQVTDEDENALAPGLPRHRVQGRGDIRGPGRIEGRQRGHDLVDFERLSVRGR